MKLNDYEINYLVERVLPNLSHQIEEMKAQVKSLKAKTKYPEYEDGSFSPTQEMQDRMMCNLRVDVERLQEFSNKLNYIAYEGVK